MTALGAKSITSARNTSTGVISRQISRTDRKLDWVVLKGDLIARGLKRASLTKQVKGWELKSDGDVQSFRSTAHEVL